LTYEGNRRSWGKAEAFLDERTAAAEHDEEWTAGLTIYAHYCRWCYLSDRAAQGKKALLVAMRKRGAQEKDVNQVRIYSLKLLDIVKKEQQSRRTVEPVESKMNGDVKIKRDLTFVDGTLLAGTEVPWLVPTEAEKIDIENKSKRHRDGGESSYSWLVIIWLGRRRRVPGDSVERLC
jgi:hypothetical protein